MPRRKCQALCRILRVGVVIEVRIRCARISGELIQENYNSAIMGQSFLAPRSLYRVNYTGICGHLSLFQGENSFAVFGSLSGTV